MASWIPLTFQSLPSNDSVLIHNGHFSLSNQFLINKIKFHPIFFSLNILFHSEICKFMQRNGLWMASRWLKNNISVSLLMLIIVKTRSSFFFFFCRYLMAVEHLLGTVWCFLSSTFCLANTANKLQGVRWMFIHLTPYPNMRCGPQQLKTSSKLRLDLAKLCCIDFLSCGCNAHANERATKGIHL